MLFYFRTLLKEVEAKLPGYDTVCQDLLEVLLLQLMRRSKFSLTFLPTSRKSTKECAVVRRYMENHFKENLTLEQLAAVAHVNKYYLVHSLQPGIRNLPQLLLPEFPPHARPQPAAVPDPAQERKLPPALSCRGRHCADAAPPTAATFFKFSLLFSFCSGII